MTEELSILDTINELRVAHSARDYIKQIGLFTQLGDSYLNAWNSLLPHKALDTWQGIIYACALYNYALTLLKYYPNQGKISQIKYKILEVNDSLRRKFSLRSCNFEKFLLEVNANISELQFCREPFLNRSVSVDNLYITNISNIDQVKRRKNKIQNMNLKYLAFLTKQSMRECGIENELRYALTVAGSNAEIPSIYSDYEFFFLVENEEDRNLFVLVSLVLSIKIVNLGETPMRMLNIPSLGFLRNDFNSLANNGFTLDGIKVVGIFPLPFFVSGKKFLLINTPSKLAELQKFHGMNLLESRNVPSCISSSKFVTGNAQLHNDYRRLVIMYMNSPLNDSSLSNRYARYENVLFNDLHPLVIRLKPMIIFKHELLKPLKIILIDMSKLMGGDEQNVFDVVDWLVSREILTRESGDEINRALAWLYSLQDALYHTNFGQRDKLPVILNYSSKKRYVVGYEQKKSFLKNKCLSVEYPHALYPLEDLESLCKLFQVTNSLRSRIYKLIFETRINFTHGFSAIQLDYDPVIPIMEYITNYLSQDNTTVNSSQTNKIYHRILKFLFDKKLLKYWLKHNDLKLKGRFICLYLYIFMSIIKSQTQNVNVVRAKITYDEFIKITLKLIEKDIINEKCFFNKDANIDAIMGHLYMISPRLPTLVSQLFYIYSRFHFYSAIISKNQSMKYIKAAIKVRNYIENHRKYDDFYNKKKLDSITCLRASAYYHEFDNHKESTRALLILAKKYYDLALEVHDDFNTLECCRNVLKIYSYITNHHSNFQRQTGKLFFMSRGLGNIMKDILDQSPIIYKKYPPDYEYLKEKIKNNTASIPEVKERILEIAITLRAVYGNTIIVRLGKKVSATDLTLLLAMKIVKVFTDTHIIKRSDKMRKFLKELAAVIEHCDRIVATQDLDTWFAHDVANSLFAFDKRAERESIPVVKQGGNKGSRTSSLDMPESRIALGHLALNKKGSYTQIFLLLPNEDNPYHLSYSEEETSSSLGFHINLIEGMSRDSSNEVAEILEEKCSYHHDEKIPNAVVRLYDERRHLGQNLKILNVEIPIRFRRKGVKANIFASPALDRGCSLSYYYHSPELKVFVDLFNDKYAKDDPRLRLMSKVGVDDEYKPYITARVIKRGVDKPFQEKVIRNITFRALIERYSLTPTIKHERYEEPENMDPSNLTLNLGT